MQILPKNFDHGIATRMQAHLNNTCLGASENAKSNSKQKNIQPNISIPYISTKQESLEYILAQALFATGVPFSFLDNPYVIKFFQHIRPAFKLPNQKKLADELIDKVYENVKKESDKQILEAQKESKICNIEPIGYNTFNTFTNQKFEQEKSVELFIKIVKFRNKSSPYDDYIIWELAAILNLGIFLSK
ncbi:14638_t:CDS:2 [Cetraspora pellucida]|uniref:14638_t:CDS:1 n=1 Tax=Cetraspora pellucida TaxID=1433469 RepID=A0A9N9P2V4_9GLOM|nr:14638_t:CDS:2 [Cetraspora pellucida]